MKKAIGLSLALVVFTGVGSVNLLPIVPYVVFGSIILFTILAVMGKINKRYYPIYIYGLALSLLWQTSMLGTYIVGVDIHTEYWVANRIIEGGWDVSWANNSNTSWVLGLVVPALDKIGIDVIWQFKLLFPMVVALAPLFLYYAFRRRLGEDKSYLAVLFYMTMPMFTMEVVSIVKSQWAYMFIALMVLFLASDYKPWKKSLGIIGAGLGAAFSHYAIAIMVFAYIVAIFGILLVTNWGKVRAWFGGKRLPLRYLALSCSVLIGLMFAWYSVAGQGSIVKVAFATGGNLVEVIKEVATSESTEQAEAYYYYTQPVEEGTYLDNQEQLIRTAIGLDFMRATKLGKTFRVFQYLTQIFIVLGFAYVLLKKGYGFTGEYLASVVASFGLLFSSVFLPFFSTTLSATRYYALALLFISPMLVIGVEQVAIKARDLVRMKKWVCHGSALLTRCI